jgi:hypothetical protein
MLLFICFRTFNYIVYLKFTSQDTILFLSLPSEVEVNNKVSQRSKVDVRVPPADVGHTVLLEHLNEINQPLAT